MTIFSLRAHKKGGRVEQEGEGHGRKGAASSSEAVRLQVPLPIRRRGKRFVATRRGAGKRLDALMGKLVLLLRLHMGIALPAAREGAHKPAWHENKPKENSHDYGGDTRSAWDKPFTVPHE